MVVVVVHHHALVHIGQAVDVIPLPRSALIILDHFVHAVVVVADCGAQLRVHVFDATAQGVKGEGGRQVRTRRVVDGAEAIVVIVFVEIRLRSVGGIPQGNVTREIVPL